MDATLQDQQVRTLRFDRVAKFLAGVGALVAGVFTYVQWRHTTNGELLLRKQAQASEMDKTLSDAAEFLASTSAPRQLRGVHLLVGVGRQSRDIAVGNTDDPSAPDQRIASARDVLVAYLRTEPPKADNGHLSVRSFAFRELVGMLDPDSREVVGLNLSRLDLSHPRLNGSGLRVRGGTLLRANLDGSNWNGASFIGCVLSEASFIGADLTDAVFADIDASDSVLDDALIHRATFARAVLVRASLQRVRGEDVDFSEADLSYSAFSPLDLRRPRVWSLNLSNAAIGGRGVREARGEPIKSHAPSDTTVVGQIRATFGRTDMPILKGD